MSIFETGAVLIGLSALFGWVNGRFLHFPHTIGLVSMALASSLIIILAEVMIPGVQITKELSGGIQSLNFGTTLLNGMLSFLLFAGAATVNFKAFKLRLGAISVMAVFGTLLSTLIVGLLMWTGLTLFGFNTPIIWCMLFGALISPTDPVAVLGIFKSITVPAELEALMAGESLLNDGIGVVVFTVILAIAISPANNADPVGINFIAEVFMREVLGGVLLGLIAGWLCLHALKSIEDKSLHVLITLAIVMCTYALAVRLEMSGPLATVAAGLYFGNNSHKALSRTNQNYLNTFWTIVDELLNSVLFLLIGFEVLLVYQRLDHLSFALLAIPVCLTARWLSVHLSLSLLPPRARFAKWTSAILTWGGLRGGIAVALALNLPEDTHKGVILSTTYAVVVFSILIQGLTLRPVAEKMLQPGQRDVK